MTSLPSAAQGLPSSPYVKDVTVQNFMAEVIQASLQLPVFVYFTAAWCGPCKQYGPLLEKVVAAAKGRVKLARVDIDKNPQLAQQFRIQSVPMVYVFLQGQPLDGFAGAMPESQLKQIIDQVAGAGPEGEAVEAGLEGAALLLEQGQAEEAELAYKSVLAVDEENTEAIAGLMKSFVAQGEFAKAEKVLADVPEAKQAAEAIVAAKAALALAKNAPQAADLARLEKAVAASPKDDQARFDLAVALFPAGRQEEAVSALLDIIARNRDWNAGAARAQLLSFFEALGFTHPLAVQGRRRLSSILFA